MIKFLLRRLVAIIPVLFVVSLVVFFILRITPGDPALVLAGDNATPQQIDELRTAMGLNQSMITQYLIWMGHALSGDLGYSFFLRSPVLGLMVERIAPTLSIALGTTVISVLFALPLGTLAAWGMGGKLDRALSAFSVAGFSVPVFVIAYVLIYWFSIHLDWLPVQGYEALWDDKGFHPWAWASHLILPWVSLGVIYAALVARVTRASVSEALTEDYIRTARAKGLKESAVLMRHALANAAVPIVTVIGIGVALLIGGVVVTETVFAIPGLGSMTVEAVLNRDFPVIQGLVMMFTLAYVLINLMVDISYLFLDPRIRY